MSPRSAAFTGFARALVAHVALGASLASVGCGGGGNANEQSAPAATTLHTYAADADAAVGPAVEDGAIAADAGIAPLEKGNPLCHATAMTCFPDDTLDACTFASDAGAPDAEADLGALYVPAVPACHVIASPADGAPSSAAPTVTATAAPACVASGLGLTNATCTQGTDCIVGHECVGASGSCRHYCCNGTSSCQVNEFCDVQPTTQDPSVVVPVCMPEVPCSLLDNDSCPASQQCSVVREDGSTSCVNVGTAEDGASCDATHCARGLVCIGAPGSATCAPLCYTSDPDACANTANPARSCVASLPLFRTKTVGVCQ
ncbi:MAG TPA: hypothetical protein VHV30_07230 [Polyangiaceae bacterium]|jgi:hypothetical protein|nr:hypothetical protein [Polyangiaceae bacterium]